MRKHDAFSFLDFLVTLVVILFLLILIPVRPSVKKYPDFADKYIDRGGKKIVKDLYGANN